MRKDEFGNYFVSTFYIDSELNRISYFSLKDYCEKYLNEGYSNMNLYQIESKLIEQGIISKIELQ